MLRNLAAAASLVVLLGACGAKGPLFLPERPAPEETVEPASDAEAPAEEPEASDEAGQTEAPPVTPPTDGASATP